ncbi:MAG: rhodanese-like domain-containing protein [Thiothrix litoralis]|uniref:rhodanese-like domain-containing protein n=1 Tax=Thiothrix lacustris TaxID=525917 RepID=UPI00048F1801|nr:rhodanese-like domain-containing protein [Thiothrix lacustris]
MYAIKFFALAITISAVVSLGACSKAESLGTNQAASATQQGSVTNVSNAELQTLLDEKVTLVDIRLPQEWQETGVVAGSHPITLFGRDGAVAPDFLAKLQKVAPLDKPVVLICRTGNRTRAGSEMLTQVGYKQVYNVTKGIMGWIQEGKAVVRQ